jgi:serine/threonine protein kinase
MEKQETIEILQRQIDLIEPLKQKEAFSLDFSKWKRDTEIAIEHIFGKDSRHKKDYVKIPYGARRWVHGIPECINPQNFYRGLDNTREVLRSMIDEITKWGIDKNDQPSFNAMAKKKKEQVFQSTFNTYHYVSDIGSGGSGIVVSVKDESNNTFALKYLNPDRISTDKSKRFKNELFFCEKNEHKNIIKVLDYGFIDLESEKCPFYVMPYYSETLRKLIGKKISPTDVLPFFSQILDGIEAAHLKKIWHRDIKPENILFDSTANTLLIADFGIAHFEEDFLHTIVETKPRNRLANFQYAAPEQRDPQGNVDHRADIYALGMILNEMFTGKLPHGTDFQKIGDISLEHAYLDSLVDQMLKQDPDQRHKDIATIKKTLIAHKNAFVSEQKLSQLKKTVVPEYESDDPLVNNPVELVTADYRNGTLIFKLNQKVNQDWVNIFEKSNTSPYVTVGCGPHTFTFYEDQATQQGVGEQDAQGVVNRFKDYLDSANQGYKNFVQKKQKRKEREERERLEAEVKEEEKRQRILNNLKI